MKREMKILHTGLQQQVDPIAQLNQAGADLRGRVDTIYLRLTITQVILYNATTQLNEIDSNIGQLSQVTQRETDNIDNSLLSLSNKVYIKTQEILQNVTTQANGVRLCRE